MRTALVIIEGEAPGSQTPARACAVDWEGWIKLWKL
eukprot:CAMPEP_0194760174 /NCGR_PEP_ID=MMETSP0323_2-20130528/13124_1 /TAXON_ID=2866 ORGANISM="Crypthecodinium cohnii, Strain Seligo" /NCGR_SAMPLE_ID=MMETSP0323_2 /ASSEMBLY_ACC=CAM_ASM_000346 /LENGTH=35 /DNA_ID= /DNA_START= /DNA_END= /DNA_ORIENTATION=